MPGDVMALAQLAAILAGPRLAALQNPLTGSTLISQRALIRRECLEDARCLVRDTEVVEHALPEDLRQAGGV